MTKIGSLLLLATAMLVITGCPGTISYSATATLDPPVTARMVEIRPGVWVVEDYEQPVFFSGGYYWRHSAGDWYRSPYVDSGWVSVGLSTVPHPILRIDRPRRYIHYRATPRQRVRVIPSRDIRRVRAYHRDGDGRRYDYDRRYDRRDDRRYDRRDDRRYDRRDRDFD